MAKSKIMIDNKKTRVTKWFFEIGEDTGQHTHEYDYIVVPMLDGQLKIVSAEGLTNLSDLSCGISYFKEKGVTHNVINNNNFQYSFVEIEIK